MNEKISIIVPNASPGRSLHDYGNRSLFEIEPDLTVIQYQLATLRKVYPRSEIIYILGHDASAIQRSCREVSKL
jgi:hypothetical protein